MKYLSDILNCDLNSSEKISFLILLKIKVLVFFQNSDVLFDNKNTENSTKKQFRHLLFKPKIS